MSNEPRLEHQTLKVRKLVESHRAGRIVIPEFQREYVWQRGKASKLIDSLYRGFPISSLLLWQSTEDVRARRRDPRPLYSASMSWLIDGQQRVTTLARTMTGDEGIDAHSIQSTRSSALRTPRRARTATGYGSLCFGMMISTGSFGATWTVAAERTGGRHALSLFAESWTMSYRSCGWSTTASRQPYKPLSGSTL
jgi:hypothetical protein